MIVAKVLEVLGIGIYSYLLLLILDGGSAPLKGAIAARKWRSVAAIAFIILVSWLIWLALLFCALEGLPA